MEYTLYPEHQMFPNIFPVIHKDTGKVLVGKSFDLSCYKDRKQYENEDSILRRLAGGPHIIKLHSRIDQGEKGLLVLDKLAGDLLDLLEDPEFDYSAAADVFQQTCEALQYAHQHGVAHLDIKPENVFYQKQGDRFEAVLADFGSSFIINNSDLAFGLRGTLHYAAPEVYGSLCGYDPLCADMWSLGILYHVLLTGCWPYVANSDDELRQMVASGQLDINKEIPSRAQTVIRSLLQFEPHLRPDITTLLQTLQSASSQKLPTSQSVGKCLRRALTRVPQWFQSRLGAPPR